MKGHVPPEALNRYRQLARMRRQVSVIGDELDRLGHRELAMQTFKMYSVLWDAANALRVDLPE